MPNARTQHPNASLTPLGRRKMVWGEEDTNAGEPEAEAFAARLPDATLEIVREAGHAPWIDELDFCAAKTRAFLTT